MEKRLILVISLAFGLAAAVAVANLLKGTRSGLGDANAALAGGPEGAVRKVLDDQQRAWNDGNLEEFMAGYWKSVDLTFYSGGEVRKGWKEARDRYQARYGTDKSTMGRLDFRDQTVELLAPDTALVRGAWEVTGVEKAGKGLYTLVVKKFPDGWKIVHDHTSAAAP